MFAHTVTEIKDENDNIHVLFKLPSFTFICNEAQSRMILTDNHLFGI